MTTRPPPSRDATQTRSVCGPDGLEPWSASDPGDLLLVFRDGASLSTHALTDGERLVVGRGSTADLCLSDPSLSREHAAFSRAGGRVEVQDLESKNGTFIGGSTVACHPISPGDHVWLGRVLVTLHELRPTHEESSTDTSLNEAILLALDASGIGVALLDGDGICVQHNARVDALLRAADGIYLEHQRFTVATPKGRTWLAGVLNEFGRGTQPEPRSGTLAVSIPRRHSRRPLVLRALNQPSVSTEGVGRYLALVCVDPDCPVQLDPTSLRTAYDITEAESKVASALLSGSAPREIAEVLGVTLETVRSHLSHLYAKTDTRRQAELVRLLLRTSGGIWG